MFLEDVFDLWPSACFCLADRAIQSYLVPHICGAALVTGWLLSSLCCWALFTKTAPITSAIQNDESHEEIDNPDQRISQDVAQLHRHQLERTVEIHCPRCSPL